MSSRNTTKASLTVPQLPDSTKQKLSDTSNSSPVMVPTPQGTPEPDDISLEHSVKMENSQDKTETEVPKATTEEQETVSVPQVVIDAAEVAVASKKGSQKDKKAKHQPKKSKREATESTSEDSDADSESEDSSKDDKKKRRKKRKLAAKKAAAKEKAKKSKKSDSSDDSSDSSSDSSSESSSEDEKRKKKKKQKRALKSKAKKKSKKVDNSSDDSSSSSSSSSNSESDSEDEKSKRKRKAHKKRKSKASDSSESSTEASSEDDVPKSSAEVPPPVPAEDIDTQVEKITAYLQHLKLKQLAAATSDTVDVVVPPPPPPPKVLTKKNAHEFKRIDQVWDITLRDYKLVESTAEQKDEFDCVFTVRRKFDWDGKHKETQVDIKSKVLRNALQVVFKECKGISLVEEIPQIDPHTLFHYYEEIKTYVKKTLKPKLKRAKRTKKKKLLTQELAQCKLLLGYIDEDYAATRKALKPMLKAGTITYDLCWALFKPNSIAYTPTYGNKDDPRCFKIDLTYEHESWLSGAKSWVIDGRYLEYDGKVFGLGDHQVQISAFKGHKKITNLAAYPLEYHQDPKGIKKLLIERGKKFVALQGMSYRLQKGIAYMKVKATIAKFNINGRVMVDPAIFRRINPNYPLSYIRQDELDPEEDEDEDDCCCSEEEDGDDNCEKDKLRIVMWKDGKGKKHPIYVYQSEIDQENAENPSSALDTVEDGPEKRHVFSEEELLIASPVVLGFAFSEKLWLEFSLSGVEEIKWNPEAFESLVLPDRIKSNLKGLVSSHRFNAARTIDDVIQGKGKGLNVVLHGPPGVGKTLTGESIAEYLKCPLYAVSAGELGTNSAALERDLNRIMDITHSWGAILLLDEADVFLEARQPHDIHRNSLVSVFLRLTEYYQGILFLTTNRVETFDEAFQSRIHMGIRYENLEAKARKKIWQHHVGKVVKMSKGKEDEVKPFKDADFDELSKKNMNGRQIKNTVKTSQSIALSEKATFCMEHIKRVLEVAEAFEDDMRGGKGYRDAMRQYT